MRSMLVAMLGIAILSPVARAQGRDHRSLISAAVQTWNDGRTLRVTGSYDLPEGREVDGTVAVLNGPVTITGRIAGTLVAINADVRLMPGARIDRDLLVVGGTVQRGDDVTIGGEVRTQAELLRYTMDGEQIVADEPLLGEWRPRVRSRLEERGSYTELFFVAARTYNRVEGLPIGVGPKFRRTTDWGRIQVEALGVFRTADPIRWDRGTVGHDARTEIRLGRRNGAVITGRLFDVIAPVEDWQLREIEAGLSTFLRHQDLRDHYGRHGAEVTIGGRLGEEASLQFGYGSERWRSVADRNPVTVLRDREEWRPNPGMDHGSVDLLTARLRIDTRERLRSPWTGGWYIQANVEQGSGTIARNMGTVLGLAAPEAVSYVRGFVDARRYNRLSPGTELNFRIVSAGWLSGDQLPLQRRLSVGGPGSIEGYDFRRAQYDDDVFTCGGIGASTARTAMCDRIAVAQVELRQDFHVGWVRTDRNDEWWRPGLNGNGQWVIFADAGRGWTVGSGAAPVRQDNGIPDLATFRTSIGAGVDFGELGFYFTKSVSTPEEKVNFLLRVGRRF